MQDRSWGIDVTHQIPPAGIYVDVNVQDWRRGSASPWPWAGATRAGTGTAVGVKVGVAAKAGVGVPVRSAPVRMMIPCVGSGVGVRICAIGEGVGTAGVGDGVGSLTHPMVVTAAPISRTARNIVDMCLLYRFNTVRVLPIEWLEISSRLGCTRPLPSGVWTGNGKVQSSGSVIFLRAALMGVAAPADS